MLKVGQLSCAGSQFQPGHAGQFVIQKQQVEAFNAFHRRASHDPVVAMLDTPSGQLQHVSHQPHQDVIMLCIKNHGNARLPLRL
jgi:hypothetical protein